LTACLAVVLATASAGQPPPPSTTTFRTYAQEVLLDLVVRDKRGHLVKDLKPEELEVLENNSVRPLRSLRLIEGWNVTDQTATAESQQLDPLRQLRLVVLALDRLGPGSRRIARDAAKELFSKPLEQNVYYMVVQLDPVLRVIRPFTNDRTLLRWAVDQATGSAATSYTAETSREQATDPAQQAMQRIVRAIEQATEDLSRDQQGSQSVYGLLSLVSGLRVIEGRKTVLYFSDGLELPPAVQPAYQSLLGSANRTNTSFYSIDARGLTTRLDSGVGLPVPLSADPNSAGNPPPPDTQLPAVAPAPAIRGNAQNNLLHLAQSTGGLLLANTNDFRSSLQRIKEDVYSYYLASYLPEDSTWDGKFRPITVRLKRPGLTIQTRNGYIALPPEAQAILLSHEVPLFKALSATPLPKQIDYRAAAFHFRPGEGDDHTMVQCAFHIEVPLENVTIRRNEAAKTFEARVAFLVLMKDPQGVIKRKISRDVPYSGPLDKLDQFRQGNIAYNEYFPLAPGRYVMESALVDRIGEKLSAKRQSFLLAAPPPGIAISTLTLVRRVEPAGLSEGTAEARAVKANDPFRFPAGKVIPALTTALKRAPDATLGVFFSVFLPQNSTETPLLSLEIVADGKQTAQAQPTLPTPDPAGRIPFLASLPIGNLAPGAYQLVATVRQGQAISQEMLGFDIE
jgi:VWFA-related protein